MPGANADFTLRLIDKLTRPAHNASRALHGLAGASGKVRRSGGGGGGGLVSFLDDAGKGLGMVAGAAMRAVKAIGAITVGAVGLGGAAAFGIAQLGSKAEQSQTQIAGFLQALEFTPSFTDGLEQADSIIRQIKKDSAALPGEAEDYIEVFKSGLPALSGALGTNLKEITAFSNRFTAVTNTLGVDTQQAGLDLQRMLQAGRGGAGQDVRSFTQLLPFLRQIEGQAQLTAESFNQLTQSRRAELLTQAMAKLDPMLEHNASSFDAMFGALKTSALEILKLATAPLFEAMKSALGEANLALMDADGNLTPFAKQIVDVGKDVADFLVPALKSVWNLAKEFGLAFGKAFTGQDFSGGADTLLKTLASPETIKSVKEFGTSLGRLADQLGTIFRWVMDLLQPFIAWQGAVNSVRNELGLITAPAEEAGRQTMNGWVQGWSAGQTGMIATVRQTALSALQSFKDALGIASPSKEMAWVAKQVTAGYTGGLEAEAPAVQSSAAQISAATTGGAMAGADAGGGGVGGGGITFAPQITIQVGSGANAQEIADTTERTVRASFMRMLESMAPA